MRILFFGNTKYSVIDAQALHHHFGLTTVVTIPDKIGARNEVTPSPVKTFAIANNIPVIEASKLTPDTIDQIKALQPDFLVVADYGLILPQEVLNLPKVAPLNVHHSLLPKYRGTSPVPTALLQGEKKTGVTIIIMNNKVDDGDILVQKEYTITPDDTAASLLTKLNELGGQAVVEAIKHFDQIKPIKQNPSQATFTKRMEKQDGYIDIHNAPDIDKLTRMIHAYYPWPGVWTKIKQNNKEVRIKFLPENKLQVEGKKPQTIKDFLNGYPEARQWLERLLPQV